MDPKKDIITNYVDGTIKILTTNASDTVSSSADTKININGNLIVHHYLYENGRTNTKLVDDEEYSKKVGTKFLTKPNSNLLNDYKLLEVDGNEVGEYIEGKKEISYYYAKKTNVKVKYVDYYTNEPIENDELLDGYVGMKYTTTLKEFNNYKFFKDTNNTSGTMTYDNIEVIYYYVHTSTGYTVKHIDDITGDIIKEENYNDNLYQGDKYTTSPMEDNRYTLVDEKYPTNNNGILDKDNIIINYYYKKKAELKVIHINAITDDVLLEEDIVRGLEGDSYSTNEKNFKGFKYKNRTNNYEGKYSVKINNDGTWNILTEVIYYYIPQYSCTLITKGKNCTITEGESIIVDAKSNNCFTVNIKPDFGHTLESVILDNKEYPINDLILNNDKSYTLLIKDENILSNIEHIVQANANPILRDIRINKLWNDDNNKYNKRPNKVKIELLENETVIDTCILDIINKENTYTFSNLPKYNYKTQKEINYTIKETEIEENDLHFYTSEISGNMDEGYNITNTFHFDTPKISSSITKTATTEIKNSEDIIEYKLDYNAELENVLGNLSYTIVDYLPYKIDLEKSDINGGLYDEKENTITWNETIENIDTYKNNMNNLHISKELKLLYLDLDLTKENIQNKVESKLFVQNNGEISIANSSAITNINIYGNLTVHHYLYEKGKTKIKLIEDENYSEKVGTEFSVNPESSLLKNYNLIEVEGEEIGKYTEEKNEVSYYYEKIDEKNVSVLPRTGDIKNFKLKFCLIFIAIILYIYKIFNIHKIGRGVKK